MADRIDAAAFPVQGPSRLSASDARGAEPESEQLSVREHSVLPRGGGSEPGVEAGVIAGRARVIAGRTRVILRA